MRVLEIFDSLQGEGVWTGVPMTFVRLAGCNSSDLKLGCLAWCDTPGSWDPAAGTAITVEQVAGKVRLPRACVTGGEPLLQAADVAALCGTLRERGVRLHLETNGTLDLPPGCRPDWVTVSPKPPDYRVARNLLPAVDEFKFVVDRAFQPEVAEEISRLRPEAIVCLQPEASLEEESIRKATELVLCHLRWRLSLQIHKVLGIR